MCGINGIFQPQPKGSEARPELNHHIRVMNQLIKHRGPDDDGVWLEANNILGLGHTRLSIIDLSAHAHQPFLDDYGNVLVFNGEIYNYIELKQHLKSDWVFKTQSDTEVILAAYHKYGVECVKYFEGMFAFAIWDTGQQTLFIARDRVGIKPVYYYAANNRLFFSSEVKALLPFLESLNVSKNGLAEYLLFQYPLQEDLLFENIKQVLPGEYLLVNRENGEPRISRFQYWSLKYQDTYCELEQSKQAFAELMQDSVAKHLRSDVPLGVYLSGGIDSSLCALLASQHSQDMRYAINGRFLEDVSFDESKFAQDVAEQININLEISNISAGDFEKNFRKIIYHLDYPIAGPGSFAQYMVSGKARQNVKVMLGGQGGDELFGGYARYLLMYFSDVVNSAIDNNLDNSNLKPDYNNILQHLTMLKQYKPLFQQFMQKDFFADHARRYYNLINRAGDTSSDEVGWHELPVEQVYNKYTSIFNSINSEHDYVFDKVMHFDLKCSLPALLHVEDRVSMAHGLESRVPFVDHRVVEFSAKLSPELKFKNGEMKVFLKLCFKNILPKSILNRDDKMGFPVPINQWATGELKDFIIDNMNKQGSKTRPYLNYESLLSNLHASTYSRKLWGMLSLELWFQEFVDKHSYYKNLLNSQRAEKQSEVCI